jgi:hypothetical protein
MVIVAARGITGGISIGVTYFVTVLGSSVPPGIAATARCIQPVWVATYQAMVEAPVSLRKLRRVSMIPPPVGTAVARRESRSPRSKGEHCSSVELGIEPGHGSAAFVHPHGHIASEVPVSRRGSNCCESPSRQAGCHERSEGQSRLASQYSQHWGHSTGLLTSAREEQLNR